jgi:hypothetical protein
VAYLEDLHRSEPGKFTEAEPTLKEASERLIRLLG